MTDLITAGKLCKEEREKRGLSREEVHKVTKIPIDIIRRLEEDENYLRKDPYAYFLMKILMDYLQLDIQLQKDFDEAPKKTKKKQQKDSQEKENIFIRFFKTMFVFSLSSLFVMLNFSEKKEEKNDLENFFALIGDYTVERNDLPVVKNKSSKKVEYIGLKAKDHVWITAYIDGNEKVIKLKKGQRINLSFKDKIKFETIGNANSLVLIFDNKQVDFERKVIHNLFVDSEGVFYNGYNLAKEES
ncbi:Helix-turn-helix domain-containing protein [Persephonella hydrogeniphila]|uniref:Helix-turn-helix domain-containing protein n=1 Tax=Persephonella hydrogeniphila TaxID=198703 RepID=A0A285N2Q4_9AQUI|nr:helix-turn-helix domain-containing protein [Persephonella hydrogeniphila]SNZ03710.1 Helix-turn-helix domain-containing protein [Persephonella hydrogeniphila]